MKKNVKLPTILGVIILVIGMVAGIFLINSKQEFNLSADVEAIPKNVRFSNITDTSVTVSWTTDIVSNGFVNWGTTENGINKIAPEENSSKSLVHSINITGAVQGADIYLKINSNGKEYDNDGTIWQTKLLTSRGASSNALIASGNILLQDGSTPASALVYLTINGKILSSITSTEGSFIIPISTYINSVTENTIIEISVNAGNKGTSQGVIYSKSIKSMPTILIGKTYDFRALEANDSTSLPESKLSIPESIKVSSRFEVQKNTNNENSTITLDSIDNGEIINTTDPEFFGKGPSATEIQISVESELQETALTTDANGSWKWSPPKNLEQGEHKVTLKWKDASGIVRTLTRTFIVQASEGPAFESTPSAIPTTLSTSTPKSTTLPSSTPRVTTSPMATLQPTPETGGLAPTIGLFIMGIGILLSSVYVWNKSNAF